MTIIAEIENFALIGGIKTFFVVSGKASGIGG
jgi:hypothetical protein